MSYYLYQNVELFWMAVDHFKIEFGDIDRIDRKARTVDLYDGTVLNMPDDWNVT